MIVKNRLIKTSLILASIFGTLKLMNYNYDNNKLIELTLLLTVVITFINFIYPTL